MALPYFDDEMGAAVGAGFATNEAMLMGRVLYEEWADDWPKSEDEFAAFFNEHPRYVVTNTLTKVRSLFAEGLLDELRVLLHPIVVGHGQRLFDSETTQGLKLVKHEVFASGVLNLAYAPA